MTSTTSPPRRVLIGFGVLEALPDVLKGVRAYVEDHGCRWQVRCDAFSKLLASGNADGVITSLRPGIDDALPEISATGVAAVNLLHDVHPTMPSVVTDERAVGRAAADYFLGRGFRNFAYLGFDSPWSRGREEGFVEAIAEAGHRCHVCENWSSNADFLFLETSESAQLVLSWIACLPKPVAVLVCADYVASTALTSWTQAGIRVPDDVAVMGVGNLVATCELAPVPLSSVSIDFTAMAFEAARMLDQIMESGERPSTTTRAFPPSGIVARGSTELFHFRDEYVSAAMQLIHERAADGITMKELLRHVPVSRKWLDLRFKELVGRTASQEIRRLRLERVRELLLNTDLTVEHIATRCGFSRPENLTRFFRDGYGVPPETFRARGGARASR